MVVGEQQTLLLPPVVDLPRVDVVTLVWGWNFSYQIDSGSILTAKGRVAQHQTEDFDLTDQELSFTDTCISQKFLTFFQLLFSLYKNLSLHQFLRISQQVTSDAQMKMQRNNLCQKKKFDSIRDFIKTQKLSFSSTDKNELLANKTTQLTRSMLQQLMIS